MMKAYNYALSLVSTPYVVCIDHDDRISCDWERELIREGCDHSQVDLFYFLNHIFDVSHHPWYQAELHWHEHVLKKESDDTLLTLKMNRTSLKSKAFKHRFL